MERRDREEEMKMVGRESPRRNLTDLLRARRPDEEARSLPNRRPTKISPILDSLLITHELGSLTLRTLSRGRELEDSVFM